MTYGGLPLGRIVEFSGAEGSGKTTTTLDIIANAQKKYPDKQVLFVDVESTFDTNWANKLNVDCDSLILYRPEAQTAEESITGNTNYNRHRGCFLCYIRQNSVFSK